MHSEQRKAQNVTKCDETPFRLRTEYMEGTYSDLIASWAKNRKEQCINNLMQFFSEENLRQAFSEISGSKAKGHDGITKIGYGKDLDKNIQDLHQRMRKMAYKPRPARRVLIPKMDGKKRPIAISDFEDKLVQKVMANILGAIYEREFKEFSFGFRPKRSCHSAVGYLYNKLRNRKMNWVVDVDLERFFDTIDHKKLISVISEKIADKKFIQYTARLLKSGILVEGNCAENEQGTPQGSIVSPFLANIFLHHVVDQWFVETIKPKTGAVMTRYADDMIAVFKERRHARQFVNQLKDRLAEFNLKLNADKTKVVYFGRYSLRRRTFDFLGFTFYWGVKPRSTQETLKVKTSQKTLQKKIQDFDHWIKQNRSRRKLAVLWDKAAAKLRGHFNYFGVFWNRQKLYHFYYRAIKSLFKWLNRRSQKRSYTWQGFRSLLWSKPLPKPTETQRLKRLWDPQLYRSGRELTF